MIKKFKILKLFFLFSFLANISFAEEKKVIFGEALIIDGDSLRIKGERIRLLGIDAPEIKQTCKKPYLKISAAVGLIFNKDYNCGVLSKKQLAKKINNSKVKCISSSKDRYKRYLSICYKNSLNLNKWMVKQGYAVAYRKYSKQFLIDEKYAKDNELGIWQGSFLRPEKWRKLN